MQNDLKIISALLTLTYPQRLLNGRHLFHFHGVFIDRCGHYESSLKHLKKVPIEQK